MPNAFRQLSALFLMGGLSGIGSFAGFGHAQGVPSQPPTHQSTPSALDAKTVDSKPVARVDGEAITEQDIAIAMEDLGDRLPSASDAQKREYVIGYLIDLKTGAKAAEATPFAQSADFTRRISYFRSKILLDAYLTAEAKKSVTPEAAKALYDETLKGIKPEEEAHARHILLENEDEAKKVYSRLKGGEDFAKVASEVSKDPESGKDGGDLGYFTRDRMVAEFSEAAFKLQPGEISEPVKSNFGWHIIRLEDKRTKSPPAFAEVKDQIEVYLNRKSQQDIVLGLRQKAKIERLDAPAPAQKDQDEAKPSDAKPSDAKPSNATSPASEKPPSAPKN